MLFFPFGELLSGLISEVTVGGLSKLKASDRLRETRQLIRSRLLRETTLNIRILEGLSDSPALAVSALDRDSLKQIFEQPLGLGLFFSPTLPEEAERVLSELRKRKIDHRELTVGITSEVALLELLWCRIVIATAKLEQAVTSEELRRLRILLLAAQECLKFP